MLWAAGVGAAHESGRQRGSCLTQVAMAARPPQRPVPALPLSERRKLLIAPLKDRGAAEASSSSSRPGTANRRISHSLSDLDIGSCCGPAQGEEPLSSFHALFEFVAYLGAGSMTHVRLAQRRSNGEEVAVKCTCSRDEEVQRFTREEYRLMCELRHPAILGVLGLYEEQPELWIVMELCRNGCLESYVQAHGVFREDAAKGLFFQLLDGVNFLHSKRVVHRDLKPANVLLLDSASKLRIADFNSAKRIGSSSGSSLMLTDRGTHLYSAPELRFGRLWNERVDIWACGLTLFFMLRDCLPFDAEGTGVAKLLLSGKLPDIRWEGMGELVKNAVQQCLTVNMCDRPPAMELLVHPMFSMELVGSSLTRCSPQERHNALRRQSSCISTSVSSAASTLAGGELFDMFLYLPACGLVRLLGRPCLEKPAAAISFASTSSGSRSGYSSMTSSVGVGSEEAPLPRTQTPQRGENSNGKMLRQLALTKCERTLERQFSAQEDPDSPGRTVPRAKAQTGTLRRYWTASPHLNHGGQAN